MKQVFFSLAFFVLALFFVSCKKDKTIAEPPASSVAGTWKGQYNYYGYPDNYYYSFQLTADGVLKEINSYGVVVGEGTYKMTGNSFSATYKSSGSAGKTYSVAATYNQSTKKLTGTWGKGTKLESCEWFLHQQ